MTSSNGDMSLPKIRVLELYAGIGGMRSALELSGEDHQVIAALEINPIVLEIYEQNFPDAHVLRRNIENLSSEEINLMNIDMIAMSPPCQPFCRTGLEMDLKDPRSVSLENVLAILPEVNFKYIFVENVQGFETSDARELLLSTLDMCNFHWQEFLLSPSQMNIPNSRRRYYLIGKSMEIPMCFSTSLDIQTSVPFWDLLKDNNANVPYSKIVKNQDELWRIRRQYTVNAYKSWGVSEDHPRCVADICDQEIVNEPQSFLVPILLMSKYLDVVDIVNTKSVQTCCFTKGYGHYFKGTGSLLDVTGNLTDKSQIRYFSPKEISRLMCFPEEFSFPDNLSRKQRYRALGNSVNVYVIAILMSLLLSEAKIANGN